MKNSINIVVSRIIFYDLRENTVVLEKVRKGYNRRL